MLNEEADGREALRDVVRDNFEIDKMGEFADLPGVVQELLLGLLDKDSTTRWTSTEVRGFPHVGLSVIAMGGESARAVRV